MTFRHYIVAGFILLFAQGAVGQDTTKPPTGLRFTSQSSRATGLMSERGRVMFDIGHFSAVNLVYLWDEWKDSCWADSTLVIYTPTGDRLVYKYGPPDWCKKCGRWTHRDPNDLQGFMSFIKRRMK